MTYLYWHLSGVHIAITMQRKWTAFLETHRVNSISPLAKVGKKEALCRLLCHWPERCALSSPLHTDPPYWHQRNFWAWCQSGADNFSEPLSLFLFPTWNRGTPRGGQGQNIFPASEDKFIVGFEVYFQKISLIRISVAMVIISNNKIFGQTFYSLQSISTPSHFITSFILIEKYKDTSWS